MLETSRKEVFPPIPSRRYFTPKEVSALCVVKPHVLRYWEREFPQLAPIKRRGNDRRYRYHDVLLIRRIRALLYDQHLSIAHAQQRLSQEPVGALHGARVGYQQLICQMIAELEEVLQLLCAEGVTNRT